MDWLTAIFMAWELLFAVPLAPNPPMVTPPDAVVRPADPCESAPAGSDETAALREEWLKAHCAREPMSLPSQG